MNNPSVSPKPPLPWNAIFSLFTALLYGASPIDLIPDLIPILGLVDDAVIVPAFLLLAIFQFRKAKKRNQAAQRSNVIVMPPVQR